MYYLKNAFYSQQEQGSTIKVILGIETNSLNMSLQKKLYTLSK